MNIKSKELKNLLYYCLGVLLVAVIMQIISIVSDSTGVFVPSILQIGSDFFKVLTLKETYIAIINTLKSLIISVALAAVIGVLLGTIASQKKQIYLVLKPIMAVFRILPIIILITILMLSLAYENIPIIASVLVLVPIFYEGTYQGMININKDLLDVYKLNSKTNLHVIFKVHLPLISSYSKTAYINSLGMGIKVLIAVGYMTGENNTITKLIMNAKNDLNYSYVYAYSLIIILLVPIIEFLPYIIIWIKNYIMKLIIQK